MDLYKSVQRSILLKTYEKTSTQKNLGGGERRLNRPRPPWPEGERAWKQSPKWNLVRFITVMEAGSVVVCKSNCYKTVPASIYKIKLIERYLTLKPPKKHSSQLNSFAFCCLDNGEKLSFFNANFLFYSGDITSLVSTLWDYQKFLRFWRRKYRNYNLIH